MDLGKTIEDGLGVMLEQRQKGIKKYGQPLEEAHVSMHDMIRHAQEEMADGLVYTTRLQQMYPKVLEDQRVSIVAEVLSIMASTHSDEIREAQILELINQPPVWHTMYVQPSLASVEPNLVTLARRQVFPFTKRVLVRL